MRTGTFFAVAAVVLLIVGGLVLMAGSKQASNIKKHNSTIEQVMEGM